MHDVQVGGIPRIGGAMSKKPYDYMKHVEAYSPEGVRAGRRFLRKLVREAVRRRNGEYSDMAGETVAEFVGAADRIAKELIR